MKTGERIKSERCCWVLTLELNAFHREPVKRHFSMESLSKDNFSYSVPPRGLPPVSFRAWRAGENERQKARENKIAANYPCVAWCAGIQVTQPLQAINAISC